MFKVGQLVYNIDIPEKRAKILGINNKRCHGCPMIYKNINFLCPGEIHLDKNIYDYDINHDRHRCYGEEADFQIFPIQQDFILKEDGQFEYKDVEA